MRLFEFQGKQLLGEAGVTVPAGELLPVVTADAARSVRLSAPRMLKAQVLTGGRGKAGLIRFWDGGVPLSEAISGMIGATLCGEAVVAILAEERLELQRELYLSLTYRGDQAEHLLTAGSRGGVEIDETARRYPEQVLSLPLDPFVGPTGYQLRILSRHFGMESRKDLQDLHRLIENLCSLYRNADATLVEINPLGVTHRGLVAVDAKIAIDDKARFRHRELFERLEREQSQLDPKRLAPRTTNSPYTITYVPLGGSIGLISDGAGTGMLSMDLIKDEGSDAACFCELGGITNAEVMFLALERATASAGLKSLLVVLIGGFNRMDDMAMGIIRFEKERGFHVPLSVRMCGTKEVEGKALMAQAGLETHDDLLCAVRAAVGAIRRL